MDFNKNENTLNMENTETVDLYSFSNPTDNETLKRQKIRKIVNNVAPFILGIAVLVLAIVIGEISVLS